MPLQKPRHRAHPLLAREYESRVVPALLRWRIFQIRLEHRILQDELLGMMRKAGFEQARFHNLSGGIVALHKGYKL